MYDIPEPRYYLEPKKSEVVGYCAQCGQDIYVGEDIWEIKGEWYCECCVDSFRTEAERDDYFENVLCDRCFKDVMKDKVLHKFGSVVYCKKCHEEIEKELFDELLKDYLATKDEERENELAYEIANYKFLRKEA